MGTRLLRWADEACRSRGIRVIELDVVRGNPALRLYERQGYVLSKGCSDEWCSFSAEAPPWCRGGGSG